MNSKELSEILMYGINEMYNLLKDANNEDFDFEKCKIKIATNNSLTMTAKTLIQNEVLKATLNNSKKEVSTINSKLLKESNE